MRCCYRCLLRVKSYGRPYGSRMEGAHVAAQYAAHPPVPTPSVSGVHVAMHDMMHTVVASGPAEAWASIRSARRRRNIFVCVLGDIPTIITYLGTLWL